jgi:uncharacterized membrane protein YeaQ/YmgE (transglycosylase-associated protein family)
MGMTLWIVSGLLAAILPRLLPFGRLRWFVEFPLGILAAVAGGLTATAFDFGGWREVEWRAGLFAFLVGFATIGCARAFRQLSLRRQTS